VGGGARGRTTMGAQRWAHNDGRTMRAHARRQTQPVLGVRARLTRARVWSSALTLACLLLQLLLANADECWLLRCWLCGIAPTLAWASRRALRRARARLEPPPPSSSSSVESPSPPSSSPRVAVCCIAGGGISCVVET